MNASDQPLLVVVTGPPGAGKTTLARPLAEALGLPLIARDELKELLYVNLGTGDLDHTRRLGRASFALLFLLVRRLLEAGSPLVVEANFFRGRSEGEFATLPPHRLVQVHCSAPADVVLDRYRHRVGRHPGHLDQNRIHELADRLRVGDHEPLDLPGEIVRVDTSNEIEAKELAERIRSGALG